MMTYADVNSIMVLGDSVSKGVVLNPEKKRYVFSNEGFIKKLTGKIRPKVFDFSKFGSTTGYGQSLLENKFSELEPDLVLIEYGSNDCDYKWDEVAEDPYAVHLPNLSLREYKDNITAMVTAIREKGKIPILTNLHPLSSRSYFNWFTKNDPERQRATMKWLRKVENIYWWQEMYSYALERVAETFDVFVVNIRGAFLKHKDYEKYLCEDGIHPNEAGHELMESVFMETIRTRAAALL